MNRFKDLGNYTIDRYIFIGFNWIVLFFLLFVAWSYNFNLNYFNCIEGDSSNNYMCKNLFYKPATWENLEYLPPGEYGNKPGALFNSIFYVPIILLILSLFINHLIYNKGKKPDFIKRLGGENEEVKDPGNN